MNNSNSIWLSSLTPISTVTCETPSSNIQPFLVNDNLFSYNKNASINEFAEIKEFDLLKYKIIESSILNIRNAIYFEVANEIVGHNLLKIFDSLPKDEQNDLAFSAALTLTNSEIDFMIDSIMLSGENYLQEWFSLLLFEAKKRNNKFLSSKCSSIYKYYFNI